MNDLRCVDCDQPVGLIRVMKGDIRPGHLRQPDPLHPVRLASGAQQSHSGISTAGRPSRADSAKGRAGREVPATRPRFTTGGTTAPASEAGQTPATPPRESGGVRRRSTRRRVCPASAV